MSEAEQGPRVGALLFERFSVLEVIGRGGMGIVVRAFDNVTRSEVAVKHVRPDLAEDRDYAERLLREAQLARDVSHHNVCRVHEVYRRGNEVLLSMEYVKGETLRKRLDRGPLPAQEALHIARQVCAGVAAAHDKGVVHRDLKPENVLIDASASASAPGRVVVLDFGVARKEGSPRDTVTGIALGTPRYMAPEQQLGKAVSPATDVFALGLVIEEIFGNERPPAWLRPIIRRATERDPRRRYPDAGALLRELSHPWLHGPTVAAIAVAVLLLGSGLLLLQPALRADVGALLSAAFQRPAEPRREPQKILLSRQWSGAQLATVSPDGQLLAYLEETNNVMHGFLRPLRGGAIRPIGGRDQSISWLGFSPDGKRIAFSAGHQIFDRAGEVYVVDSAAPGSAPERIAHGSTPSFFPDGSALAISHYSEDTGRWHLARVPLSGDRQLQLIDAEPPARSEFCPVVSPDGRRLAYVAGPSPGGVRVVPVGGGAAITLDAAPFFYERLQWTPDSRRVLFGTEHRGLLSVEAREGARPTVLLPPEDAAHSPSLTRDGRHLVFTRATEVYDLQSADRDGRNHQEIPVNFETYALGWPLFSPDGQSIALMISTGGGSATQVALVSIQSGTVRTVGQPRDIFVGPESFVDGGRSLIVGSRKAGELKVLPLGDAPPLQIDFSPEEINASVSPDGKRLATTRMEGKEGTIVGGLWVRPIDAPARDAVGWVPDGLGRPTWSPDGRQIAVGTSKGDLAIASGPGAGEVRRIRGLTDPAGAPLLPKIMHFASDGQLLFAQHPRIYALDLSSDVARPIISPERIINLFGFTISPDGKKLVYAVQPIHSDLWLVDSSEKLFLAGR